MEAVQTEGQAQSERTEDAGVYAAGGVGNVGGGWMDGGRIRRNAVQNLEINPLEYAATLSLLLHHSCFNLREQLDWLNIFALCQTAP